MNWGGSKKTLPPLLKNKNMTKIPYIISYILLALLTSNCSQSEHKGHSHEAEAEQEEHAEHAALTQTLFTNELEFYAEYPALIVGEKSVFTSYITERTNYSPAKAEKITISLIKGKKGIRNTSSSPLKPGVFSTSLHPKEAGMYTLQVDLLKDGKNIRFSANNIEVYKTHEAAEKAASTTKSGNEITYLKEQAWANNFGIIQIKKNAFKEVIHTSGKLLPANGDENTIVAPFTGIVTLNSHIVPGAKISKGASILELSGKGLASDNISVHYNQLKTDYERTKSVYERAQQLIDEKIISQKEYIEAKTEFEQAKVAYENINYSEDGSVNKVTATLNGFVKTIHVNDGEFVLAGTPLVVLAENKRLIIQADVSQKHWHCLPEISEANFLTPYDAKVYNTKELNGKLLSYSRNASNSAWSTPVFFEINNSSDFLPGTYIEVYLMSKLKTDVLAIPLSAIIEEQGNHFVFVQINGETYEKRPVELGQSNGFELEVLSGLNDGDFVVSKGAYQVKLASMSAALPSHDHNH